MFFSAHPERQALLAANSFAVRVEGCSGVESSMAQVILGIDPGFSYSGFAILKKDLGKTYVLDYGALKMSSNDTLAKRIGIFHTFMEEKIKQHGVTHLALETPFLGKNAQNFLKLGYLRGIIYLLSDRYSLPMGEFSPREVKMAVTGFGGADKEQVARVVLRLFPALVMPNRLDVTDAFAVTLCGMWKQ